MLRPSVASGSGYSSTPVSTRTFLQTVCQPSRKLRNLHRHNCITANSMQQLILKRPLPNSKPSWSTRLPLCGWDTAGQNFITSTGMTEQNFWTAFWTDMANSLKAYPNAIFEAWNEPDNGNSAHYPQAT